MGSKYDFINRFRSYVENSFRDTNQDRWRKVIKLSTQEGTRGTQKDDVKVLGTVSDYGRKPYTASGDYTDMMNDVTRSQMQDQAVEPYSNRDKPYADSEASYSEVEYLQPEPLGFTPWSLPFNKIRPVPSDLPSWSPGSTQTGCGLWLHSPMNCDGDVKGRPNQYQGSQSQLQFEVYVKYPDSGWTKYKNWSVKRDYLHIHAPSGGWSPKYSHDCPVFLDEHYVYVRMTDGVGNVCDQTEKVSCLGECINCCTDPATTTFTFDDTNTSDTIVKNSNIEVYVTGGCAPFTFATASTGYYWDAGLTQTSLVTNYRQATLYCKDGTCGSDYAVYCDLTVTDYCGTVVTATIRNTAGTWVSQGHKNGTCPGCSSVACSRSGCSSSSELISGHIRWLFNIALCKQNCGTAYWESCLGYNGICVDPPGSPSSYGSCTTCTGSGCCVYASGYYYQYWSCP